MKLARGCPRWEMYKHHCRETIYALLVGGSLVASRAAGGSAPRLCCLELVQGSHKSRLRRHMSDS